jgi:hypothetical protein
VYESKEPGNFGDPFGIIMYNKEMRSKEINNSRLSIICVLGSLLLNWHQQGCNSAILPLSYWQQSECWRQVFFVLQASLARLWGLLAAERLGRRLPLCLSCLHLLLQLS